MMELAGGWLGWSEDQFWQSSPVWFRAAWEGFVARHGGADTTDEETLRAEYEASKREHAAALSRSDEDLRLLREERKRRGAG